MTYIWAKILEYAILLYIIALCLVPVVLVFLSTPWYINYKERKELESWEIIGKFFEENADEYPDAAISFGMARFWASKTGYNTMYKIKEAEYYGN